MHDIEPHYHWRERYIASDDDHSPFYGRQYDEFNFTNKIYNYFVHPQWDEFGSQTLYLKILFVDYLENYAIIELIGEWNDCIGNDIMFLKREVIDQLASQDINKYILLCENVLNFHGDDDDYYQEWYDDIKDEEGWVIFANTLNHVGEEMKESGLDLYANFGENYNFLSWRSQKPSIVYKTFEERLHKKIKRLNY